MSNYAIFFDYGNTTYRLPVNPEQIEIKQNQQIEKYEILKLGQIAIPAYLELKEYTFECELPGHPYSYIETTGDFKTADYYLILFNEWREIKAPVRFIASNGIGDDTNTLVLIKDLSITEKAGEEGDKHIRLTLTEYKEFSKKTGVVIEDKIVTIITTKAPEQNDINRSQDGYYVVIKGDTLYGIAKRLYGDGSKCNIIYNANKDKIKNPNLISIGWKLRIPSASEFSKYSAPLPKTVSKIEEKKVLQKVSDKKNTQWDIERLSR